jgi:hypothetical protein
MVYDATAYNFRGLNKGVDYYACIQAIGETGVSAKSNVVKF